MQTLQTSSDLVGRTHFTKSSFPRILGASAGSVSGLIRIEPRFCSCFGKRHYASTGSRLPHETQGHSTAVKLKCHWMDSSSSPASSNPTPKIYGLDPQ